MAHVLVVDDQAVNRVLMVALLEHAGHVCSEAVDGMQALVQVRDGKPDLVLCDLLMPTMDGYEFVRRMRQEAAIAHTRVIFYTATFVGPQARRLALDCGVLQLLTKPCDPQTLLAAVANALAEPTPSVGESEALQKGDQFDHSHRRLVADMLAEKATELERANLRLDTLARLNLHLASVHDPHELLDKLCRGARELLGARCAVLCADAPDGNRTPYRSHWGCAPDEAQAWDQLPLRGGVPGQVMADQKPRRFSAAGSEAALPPTGPSLPTMQSGLLVPIASLNQVYGWLALIDKLGEAGFSEEDERLLNTHAAQAGRIYENSNLNARLQHQVTLLQREIAERQQVEDKLRRLARVSAVQGDINSLIVRVRERGELFREACRIAVEVGQFKKAWIGLCHQEIQALTLTAAAGEDDGYLDGLRQVLAQPPTPASEAFRKTLVKGAPIILNDISQIAEMPLREVAMARGSRAVVWLPLMVSGRQEAVLVLHADKVGFFDDEEMKLLRELAGDMAFALEHIAQQERLTRLYHFDLLTGLANGTLFHEWLEQQLLSAKAGGQKVAMILLDVVRFKVVNDTLGRHAGDTLLKLITARLLSCLGEGALLARISADRFALLLPGVRSESDVARWWTDHYQSCFGTAYALEGKDLRLSAKIGIALHPNDGLDAETLYRNAEAALKNVKNSTDTMLFYSPQMSASVAEVLMMETKLRLAIERDEFVLHYQPKVDVDTCRIVGLEALLRWNCPDQGLVSPMKFIPLLEETGLILEVGAWALQQAMRDCRGWQRLGLNVPRIAVNVSAVQLHRPDFVDTVLAALEDGLPDAPAIDLEITESMVMKEVQACIGKLHALRARGVQVAIDDFGTGYSSLAYLSKLPAQFLKIDRAFIQSMLHEPDDMMLVSTMVSMAHSLRMKVIAEGVETQDQAKMLRLLRCDQMQGYLLSRPVEVSAVATMLRSDSALPAV